MKFWNSVGSLILDFSNPDLVFSLYFHRKLCWYQHNATLEWKWSRYSRIFWYVQITIRVFEIHEFRKSQNVWLFLNMFLWVPWPFLWWKQSPRQVFKDQTPQNIDCENSFHEFFFKIIEFMTHALPSPPDLRVGDRFYIKNKSFYHSLKARQKEPINQYPSFSRHNRHPAPTARGIFAVSFVTLSLVTKCRVLDTIIASLRSPISAGEVLLYAL